MADYLVLYSNVTGFVLGSWSRSSSDNASTFAADGYLEADGVHVVEGIGDRSDLAAVVLTDPTDIDTEAPLNTHRVDDLLSPTDGGERTDSSRDPDYIFDNPVTA